VVVAKFNFVDGDRIVLVDDRHHAALQQRRQRVAGVEMPVAVLEIIVREKNLRDRDSALAETLVVKRHQLALADGRTRLQLMEMFWALLKPERSHAGRDGAG